MATFAEDQLARIEAVLAKNPGVRQVSVDGVLVAYDDLLVQRDYYKREVLTEQGKRSRFYNADLGGF